MHRGPEVRSWLAGGPIEAVWSVEGVFGRHPPGEPDRIIRRSLVHTASSHPIDRIAIGITALACCRLRSNCSERRNHPVLRQRIGATGFAVALLSVLAMATSGQAGA